MDQHGRSRRRREAPSPPTSLHEITRRYVATALALSKAMGVPYTETFLREHRESITSCFIQAGMEGIRLPAAVQLPPLATIPGVPVGEPRISATLAEKDPRGQGDELPSTMDCNADPLPAGEGTASVTSTTGDTPLPTRIPAEGDWPCAGQAITHLKPAQLHLLVSRAGFRAHADTTVLPLLAALQIERGKRLEQGQSLDRTGVRRQG